MRTQKSRPSAAAARRTASLAAVAALTVAAPRIAFAQTYNYTGGASASAPVTGVFSTGFNPTLTTGSTSAILSFAGSSSYTATDDLASTVSLNSLVISNSAGTATLATGSGGANSLTFGGTNPGVSVTGDGNALVSLTLPGAESLTKSGAGTLTMNVQNLYTGGTVINSGIISVASSLYLGANPTVATTNITFNGGALALTNSGTITFSSFRNILLNAGGGTINTTNGSVGIPGIISGTGALTKTGSGTLTLTATNPYTGGTVINGGTISVASSLFLGANPTAAATNVTFGGGTLSFTNSSAIFLSSFRNMQLNSGGGTIDTTNAGVSISSVISGAGSLTKTGSGTLTLSGTNTYTGGTFLNAGTLNITSNAALGPLPSTPTTTVTINGGTLQFAFTATGATAMGANRQISLGTSGGTIDTQTNAVTILSSISGSGGLTKVGTGTLTLAGTNAYLGATTVSAGTLSVTGSTASSGTVTVGGTGTTLAGSGSVGNIVLNTGGTLGPGTDNADATLKASSFTWNDGTVALDLGTSGDQLDVTGAFTAGGTSSSYLFSFTGGAVGQTYTLLNYGSQSGFAISQFGLASGSPSGTFSFVGNSLRFTEAGGSAAAPEPAAIQLGLLGFAALGCGSSTVRRRLRK